MSQLRLPNLARLPKELREFIQSLRGWALDRERFEKSITSASDTKSASGKLALRQGIIVDRTRVDSSVLGTSISTSGSLIPTSNNAFDIGQDPPPLRWRNLYLGRNADIDGTLDVAGNVMLAAGLSVSGGASFSTISGSTLTLSGTFSGTTISSTLGSFTSVVVGSGGISNAGGLTVSGGASFFSEITGTSLTLSNSFTANNPLASNLIVGSLSLATSIGANGLATFNGGISSTGVLTTTGQLQALAGLTVTGGVTVSGAVFFSQAAGNGFTGSLLPITTLTVGLGSNARRFGQIFGGTATLTNSLTVGGTLTVSGTGVNSIAGTLNLADANVAGILTAGTMVITSAEIDNLEPAVDITGYLGSGGPDVVGFLRYAKCNLGGLLATAKGADIASGTTLSFGVGGNYFDVTGTGTVGGISYVGTLTDPQAGIFNFVQFDGAAKMQHAVTRQVLLAGVTFVAEAGDHMLVISDGGGNWREVFRQRASGIRHQSTQTNKSMGRQGLTLGVTTVFNTAVTAVSNIFLANQSPAGTVGALYVSSRTAGASFAINSTSALDTSTIAWEIVEPEGV